MSLAYTDLLKAKKYFPTNLSCLKTNFSLLSREFEKYEHFKQHFHVILLKHTYRSIFVLLIVWFKSGLIETHYHQKELFRKSYASMVVICDSVLFSVSYRTIFLLPLVKRIIEKSIRFQIEYYLYKEKLIYLCISQAFEPFSKPFSDSVDRLCCNWYG